MKSFILIFVIINVFVSISSLEKKGKAFLLTNNKDSLFSKIHSKQYVVHSDINKNNSTSESSNIIEPQQIPNSNTNTTILKEDWLLISSSQFLNKERFPSITLKDGRIVDIETDENYFRINKVAQSDDYVLKRLFYFRLSGLNIYYSVNKEDINILGAISISSITNIEGETHTILMKDGLNCFHIKDIERQDWKLCTTDKKIAISWVCKIKELLKIPDGNCGEELQNLNIKIIEKKIIQPIFLIPKESRHCNDNWDYRNKGDDWECECQDGHKQSPIDLPSITDSIQIDSRPLFQYKHISNESEENKLINSIINYKKNANVEMPKIVHKDHMIQILHSDFGKAITQDGIVYQASEIRIHTPSDHKINGKSYPLEVQIIHYGKTVGDLGKQLVLSFMFERKAGVNNKFIDDIDVFDLPNPVDSKREFKQKSFFLPKIFYESDDEDNVNMKNFSFYLYEGSLTSPPCLQNTLVYIASKPLRLGSTALELFKEALNIPDSKDSRGNVYISRETYDNNRNIQDRKNRPVWHYDHEKFCGADPVKKKIQEVGHFEKIPRVVTEYLYVDGTKPTGFPGAMVISKDEALGQQINIINSINK